MTHWLHGHDTEGGASVRHTAQVEALIVYESVMRLRVWFSRASHAGCLAAAQNGVCVLPGSPATGQRARQVFREDLAEHPSTGFALLGLAGSLAAQGRAAEADAARAEFERAWRWADAPLASSCPAFSERA